MERMTKYVGTWRLFLTYDENLLQRKTTHYRSAQRMLLLDILETSIAEGSAIFRDQENQEIGLNKEFFNDDEVIDHHGEYIPTEDDTT